jgi:chromosome partitioning protein
LVVPTTPDVLSLDAPMQTVHALRSLGSEAYRVLVTMVPPRPSRDGEEARGVLLDAGLPLFDGWVRRFVTYQKAALAGVPVSTSGDPRAAGAWGDYARIGDWVGRAVHPDVRRLRDW